MADGFVGGGPRKGYYTRYRRDPKLLDIIPVSDSGELLPPTNAGLIGPSTVTTANQSTIGYMVTMARLKQHGENLQVSNLLNKLLSFWPNRLGMLDYFLIIQDLVLTKKAK